MRIFGLFLSLITSLLGAVLAAKVLVSTVDLGVVSIFLMALAALVVLGLGAMIYFKISPQD